MSHPSIVRLRELLPPPVSGGDAVDWAGIERTTGLAFPADYREFVETYGGGEIDEYMAVSTPPVPGSPYGDLLDRVDPALGYLEELGALLPTGAPPLLLPFAYLGHGDVAFWLREGPPDDWWVAVFQRQVAYGMNHWIVFEGGMAPFCVAVLTGEADSLGVRLPAGSRHEFMSWRGA